MAFFNGPPCQWSILQSSYLWGDCLWHEMSHFFIGVWHFDINSLAIIVSWEVARVLGYVPQYKDSLEVSECWASNLFSYVLSSLVWLSYIPNKLHTPIPPSKRWKNWDSWSTTLIRSLVFQWNTHTQAPDRPYLFSLQRDERWNMQYFCGLD